MRNAAFAAIALVAVAGAASGCSIELRDMNASPEAVSNSCKVDADCGTNAICSSGLCYAKSGVIDEVLLEIVPEANSAAAGLSFLSLQTNVMLGDRARLVELPNPTDVLTQVTANGSDLLAGGCKDYVVTGAQTIQARIEFSRVGAIGGLLIPGLSSVPVTVDTMSTGGVWNATASLLPGTYDIYVQPLVSNPNCKIAPRLLRGIDVVPQTDPSSPPGFLELPAPATLNGKVQRNPQNPNDTTTSLEGWSVDIIEPQEGRVISTVGKLGPTSAASPLTNFVIAYQRPTVAPTRTSTAGTAPTSGPLVRVTPPTGMAETAPVVYWDLAAADLAGDGHCDLDMSGVPSTGSLVDVSGRIQGNRDSQSGTMPVRATLQFQSVTLDHADGLTAVFKRSVTTDDMGRYATQLFPGMYRVVILPVASPGADIVPPTTLGEPQPMGAAALPWAVQEEQWRITPMGLTLDAVLREKRAIVGGVFAGVSRLPDAAGATINAIATILPSQLGTLKNVLAQVPILPQNASISVGSDGAFRLPLDPGDFDIYVRTPESSNFAWWVWPSAHISLPDSLGNTLPIQPRIPFPVPLEGEIKVPDAKDVLTPLRGAAVRAYAKVPSGGVAKVGDTRTDDMGRYRLRLPPSFGAP